MLLRRFFTYLLLIAVSCHISFASCEAKDKVAVFDVVKFHHFSTIYHLPDNRISDVLEDKKGNLWISMINGLCRFDGLALHTYLPDGGTFSIPDNRAGHMCLDDDGTLWIRFNASYTIAYYRYATDDFVTVDSKKVTKYLKKRFAATYYNNVELKGQRFSCRNNTLTQYDAQGNDSIVYTGDVARKSGLTDSKITSITMGKRHKLWVATISDGLYYALLGGNEPRVFLPKACKSVRTICDDGENGLFVGYEGSGVVHVDKTRSVVDTCSYYSEDKECRRVRHLLLDSQKRLWIATRAGLFVSDKSRKHYSRILLNSNPTSVANRIYRLCEDKKANCVWVASWSGVTAISLSTLKPIAAIDTTMQRLHDITLDANGTLWVATENGIYSKQGNVVQCMLPDCICYAIAISADSTVWCGTNKGIVYLRRNTNQWQQLALADGNESVRAIACKDNYVYVTTSSALIEIDSHSLTAEVITTEGYNYAEGACYYNKRTGEILFGSEQGLVALYSKVALPKPTDKLGYRWIVVLVLTLLFLGIITLVVVKRKKKPSAITDDNKTVVSDNDEIKSVSAVTTDEQQSLQYLQTQSNEFLAKANGVVMAHLSDTNFGINEFALEMAMSRAQLFRKMKSLTGLTAMDYIVSLRITKSEEMLLSTTKSISEVAIECGFSDASTFRRNFQKKHGKSPTQYRAK